MSAAAHAEDRTTAVLDKLHAAQKPTVQPDLDTVKLASAHRERAASEQQRTEGLWQSWVVAICQGCGVRERLYSPEDARALVARAAAQTNMHVNPHPATGMVSIAPRVVRPLDTLAEPSSNATTAITEPGTR